MCVRLKLYSLHIFVHWRVHTTWREFIIALKYMTSF